MSGKIILVNNSSIRIPQRHDLSEIYLIDHNGTPYDYELIDKIWKDKNKLAPGSLDDAIACTRGSFNFCDIKKIFMMLTDDQRKFVMHIYCQYKKNIKLKIILLGPAGSGKTTIINLIDKLITWDGNKTSDSRVKTKVLTSAFTIKSAAKIEGFTLKSMLSKIPLRETRSGDGEIMDSKMDLKENCIFFICDEVSMVGKNLMESMNKRLQQLFENDKKYGDRFVLLVGDLYQFPPIGDTFLWPTSELWTCCELYELTEVIRQKDEKFIIALNNLKKSEMTEEDITLWHSRVIQYDDEVPDMVIHLFYQNKYVNAYNKAKLNECGGKEVTVKSLNDTYKWQSRNIRIKIGMRYMLTKNVDVSDGLENGTIGVVKGFDVVDREVTVIWMDFNSTEIGKKTRSDYLSKHNRKKQSSWIPIQRSRIVYKTKKNSTNNTEAGKIFPLIEAEAITVHRSQGQTYPNGVCIHITDDKNDMLRTCKYRLYVALSRVHKLDDLYIYGTLDFSTLDEDKLTSTENELNRLRTERKLTLAFETFQNKTDDVIIFLNTGLTFNEHYQFITTDKWYDNGSLLIFTETNTIASDDIKNFDNFEIAFRSDTKTTSRSGGGIMCYKKTSKSVKVIDTVSDEENKMYLTLLWYENYFYIITGVKGHLNEIDFTNKIEIFINQYVKDEKCIFFIGNVDFNLTPTLTQYLNYEKFGIKLPCDASGKYDMIVSRNFNINQKQYGFYEYIPSAHQPIYVKLPPKSESSITNDEPDLSNKAKKLRQDDDSDIVETFYFSITDSNRMTSTGNEHNQQGTKRKLSQAFETIKYKTDDVIIFLTTGLTFNELYQLITTDTWYGNGSLLIFTETNTIASDDIKIPNFEIAFPSHTKSALRSGGGIICYEKTSKSVEVVDVMTDHENLDLTLLLYKKYLYIITGVKGDLKEIHFKNAISTFIHDYVRDAKCIFLIGNLGPNLTPTLTDFLYNKKIRIKLSYDASDPNQLVPQHDMILTRNFDINLENCGFYKYIPSAHKPIYVKLPPKPELLKSNGEVGSVDYRTAIPSTSRLCEEPEIMEVE